MSEQDQLIFDVLAGEHIDNAIGKMIALAGKSNCTVKANFNGIELIATPISTYGDLRRHFDESMDRGAREYRESPQGQADAAKRRHRTKQLQAQCDRLIEQLPTLDFADFAAVIDWLDAYRDPSDHIDVNKSVSLVVATFRAHGFEAGVNCDDAFRANDRENVARYLIGQALDGLGGHVGAIHPVFQGFAAEWREKFEGVKVVT